MRGQRAFLALLGALALLPAAARAQYSTEQPDPTRVALHQCRMEARTCRRACRSQPGPRGVVLCQRECSHAASNCRRAVRKQPLIDWKGIVNCRGRLRGCQLACWNSAARGEARRSCTDACRAEFHGCRRAARR